METEGEVLNICTELVQRLRSPPSAGKAELSDDKCVIFEANVSLTQGENAVLSASAAEFIPSLSGGRKEMQQVSSQVWAMWRC